MFKYTGKTVSVEHALVTAIRQKSSNWNGPN